jgi:tRNA threonylcarbamoyladenosine biosynthesis protein TsaE
VRDVTVVTLEELQACAAAFINTLTAPAVVFMEGDLGAGKTTFVRAAIQALMGADEAVPSPTFTLVQTYDTPKGALWHYDLYRLQDPEEMIELGIEDAFENGIVFIEWSSRMGSVFQPRHYTITLATIENAPDKRAILIQAP